MNSKRIICLLLVGIIGSVTLPSISYANELDSFELKKVELQIPDNMPNVNDSLKDKYNTQVEDYKNNFNFGEIGKIEKPTIEKSNATAEDIFNEKYENLKDLKINNNFLDQGRDGKLSEEEFKSYISNIKNQYLPGFKDSQNKNKEVEYKPIEIVNKFNVASKQEALSKQVSLPNYQTLKGNVLATQRQIATTPSMPNRPEYAASLGKINGISGQVASSNSKVMSNYVSFSNAIDANNVNSSRLPVSSLLKSVTDTMDIFSGNINADGSPKAATPAYLGDYQNFIYGDDTLLQRMGKGATDSVLYGFDNGVKNFKEGRILEGVGDVGGGILKGIIKPIGELGKGIINGLTGKARAVK